MFSITEIHTKSGLCLKLQNLQTYRGDDGGSKNDGVGPVP